MKTTILGLGRAAGLAAIVVAAALPARAADTYDLTRRDVWKVGDVVTMTLAEHDVREYRNVSPEGTSLAVPTQTIDVAATLLERCVEADANGVKTRSLVYVRAWTAKDGVVSDTSLSGALLDVAGVGKARAVGVLSTKQELSKPALAWVQRRYGGGRAEPGASKDYWLPKVPVAVGDGWSADVAAFLDANAAGARLDRAKTTSSCVLASVEKGVARITCDANLVLAAFQLAKGAKPLPWKSGGVQVLKGTITRSIEGRLVAGTLSFASTLVGEAEVAGKTLAIDIKKERKSEETVGGDWPPDAKLPPGTPPPTPSSMEPKPPPVEKPPTPPAVPGMGG
jgi:hypothetical protein